MKKLQAFPHIILMFIGLVIAVRLFQQDQLAGMLSALAWSVANLHLAFLYVWFGKS